MADNPATAVSDNPETTETPVYTPPATGAPQFSWKTKLIPDYANSPTMALFPDTVEGFNDSVKSHLELQKMMGHEKVPIPKGPEDVAAQALFKKAFHIPDDPTGYSLPDMEGPWDKNASISDKKQFSEIVHKFNITPEQASGLWQSYADVMKTEYAKGMENYQNLISDSVVKLRGEWGDAYDSKVELGQMVINKFSDDQEMNDYITSTLAKDPKGIKFLAKVGDQFAENKIGEFKYQRHSLTPDEIDRELSAIRNDLGHPYQNDKASQSERASAIDYVNKLLEMKNRARTI
jgi:hypothetical protein